MLKYIFDFLAVVTLLLAGLYNLKKAAQLKDEGYLRIFGWWMLGLAIIIALLKLILPLLVYMGVIK
ncbi:hypothetical protein SAMN02745221_00063 [Thermosyntropha lipolytica DSM 11003]|uniref:DUF2788 domain-containing protein n=1 Tax=Thermosyntropha lipolytica DSM 11003 TaxID=1123382 RepID=A0A1M5JCS3_9FIRM|nr:hypothetical protein [Thermosyntropha lipolytica]SHG38301.1 hypothetical protein SAMN02745221_00063 [Thermosyntropha lipolytica DSM 11003]